MAQVDTPGWRWIPESIVHAMQRHPGALPKESGLFLIQVLSSVQHHVLRFLGDANFSYSLVPTRPRDYYVRFSGSRQARIRIPLLKNKYDGRISITLPRPLMPAERHVLISVGVTHAAITSSMSLSFDDIGASLLENMGSLIVDYSVASMWRGGRHRAPLAELLPELREFLEALSISTYEGRGPDISVVVTGSTYRHAPRATIHIRDLLQSKKAAALFAGHRNVLLCSLKGEIQSLTTLEPYPDVAIAPKGGNLYLGPYEYQPILYFSHKHDALTFVLTRQREILIALGDNLLFAKSGSGWHLLGIQRLVDTLELLLWDNAGRRPQKRLYKYLAIYLGMICLSLRQRGRGGLLLLLKKGQAADRVVSTFVSPEARAETFYQSLLKGKLVMRLPISLVCNAAAVDGATVMRFDGVVERFGVIVNTEKLKSSSEGARTRAAEFVSRYGVAVKISEDGPVSLFKSGQEVTSVK